jgi:hypothetical protein
VFGIGLAIANGMPSIGKRERKFCQNLLTILFGFFSCKLKNVWYNVDIRSKKEREEKMEKATSVNSFINSLPKITQKKVWKVIDQNGTVVQYVGATDNRKSSAQAYIDHKYAGQKLTLTFSHFKGLMTL